MTEQDKIKHACFIKNSIFSFNGKISPYPALPLKSQQPDNSLRQTWKL